MKSEDVEQIELILSGNYFDALQWAIRKLGLSPSLLTDTGSWEKHDKLVRACWPAFTVTRAQIDELVASRQWHPNRWYLSEPSPRDGTYFIEENSTFHFYYQERGNTGDHVAFPSVEAAMPFVLNELIGSRRFPHLVVATPYLWSAHDSWQPKRG